MNYQVSVEAKVSGDLLDDADLLTAAIEEVAPGLVPEPAIQGNQEMRMLRLVFVLDAQSGIDAHEEGFAVWRSAWDHAFPEMGETEALAITARPMHMVPAGEQLRSDEVAAEPEHMHELEDELAREDAELDAELEAEGA